MTEQPTWLGPHLRGESEGGEIPPLRLILEGDEISIDLEESGLIIGRHSEADIRLPVSDVSRKHCRFLYRDGTWLVLDLNSLNGTYVNEEQIHQVELQSGDLLRVGGFRFRVEIGLPARESDLPARIFRIRPGQRAGADLRRAG